MKIICDIFKLKPQGFKLVCEYMNKNMFKCDFLFNFCAKISGSDTF